MLSIHKSPTNKTGLRYVAPPSDTPSTSKTIFVKPVVPEPPPTIEDKGKDKINGDVLGTQKPTSIKKISHMPSLGSKWACLTLVLPSQSTKSEGQERSAQTSKL
jgi:hypothetical protein